MSVALPLLTAVVAGFLHALEADHMAAVTTFVARRPAPVQAVGFGMRWGLGHTLSLLAASAVLLLLDLRPSEGVEGLLEAGVGVMLVALGLQLVVRRRTREGGGHRHGSVWVGAAHGLAGTGAFLALVPVTLLGSPWLAGSYVLAFGVGTVVAMGLYAAVAGVLFERVGGRWLRGLTALGSMGIGLLWIARAAG